MTPARASLLLLTALVPLAVAACDTVKKPIRGFDKLPPGTIALSNDSGGAVMMWPMFDLPETDPTYFQTKLNGQVVVYMTSDEGFYDYATWQMQGWTGGWPAGPLRGVKPDTYTIEIVDGNGQSWGRSEPIVVGALASLYNPSGQVPAVIFAHFDGKVASWNIDPTTQDGDTTTDEITVTNLTDADAVVERCLISSGHSSACTAVGTVAAGADLLTVETMAAVDAKDDHQALIIHAASGATPSYQRDLVVGSANYNFGSSCQVERIVVHGPRQSNYFVLPSGTDVFAMSSCYGYGSGAP